MKNKAIHCSMKRISVLMLLFSLPLIHVVSQVLLPFQIVNNSPAFADSDIYIGMVGKTAALGDVWVDFSANSSTNPALVPMTFLADTLHKVHGDWGYAPMFTKLSQVVDRTIYLPQISGCRLFISFKKPLWFHFHQTGGYAGPNIQSATDPNAGIRFEIIELSNGSNGLWVNTTRVDAYQYPMGLEVYGKSGGTITHNKVGELQTHQNIIQRWQDTFKNSVFAPCYRTDIWGNDPLGGIIMQPSKLQEFSETGTYKNYLKGYLDSIWNYYTTNQLVVGLGDMGQFTGKVDSGRLKMTGADGTEAWISAEPNTQEAIEGKGVLAQDVLFTPSTSADKAFQAQFSAAVNRGAIDLTIPSGQPQDWSNRSKYFKTNTFNRYVWFFHQSDISLNSKTYAFAYDDVFDNSSTIQNTDPLLVKITVGGFANEPTNQLATIIVSPSNTTLPTGTVLQFTANGYTSDNTPLDITPIWSATGGTIDNSGRFSAMVAGNYIVTASVGTVRFSTGITVKEASVQSKCIVNTANGDFSVTLSADSSNPTFTFMPTVAGTGDTSCLFFYSKTPDNWNSVGAHTVKPNVPYRISSAYKGDVIYFYYVYSLAGGGQHNSQTGNDSYVVGDCSTTTDLKTLSADVSTFVYPNPSLGLIAVKVPENKYSDAVLFDANGRAVIKTSVPQGQTDFNLNIEPLNKGIYLLLLKGNQLTETVKIMKK
ncbi:MAG: beta-1,3-glucanase family protein [Bacteroidota bacterium]|nr:beta-1,3-glucanase family protein [Bacteroidota bacterium]